MEPNWFNFNIIHLYAWKDFLSIAKNNTIVFYLNQNFLVLCSKIWLHCEWNKGSAWLSLILVISLGACWAFTLEPIKLPFTLSGVCSPSEANYCSHPFEVFMKFFDLFSKKIQKLKKTVFSQKPCLHPFLTLLWTRQVYIVL